MSMLTERLGFPMIEDRDSIRFYIAKDLAYSKRLPLILSLIFLGLVLQIIFLKTWPGLPFIVAGVALGLVRGYDSRIRMKNFKVDPRWTDVQIEKVAELENVAQKCREWDRDSLDASNVLGCFLFIVLNVAGLLAAVLVGFLADSLQVLWTAWVDFLVIVVPFYFTGMRYILKQDNLRIKVKIILKMQQLFVQIRREGEELVPAMLLARDRDGKTVPSDVRFSVTFKEKGDDFRGLQAQINLNLVQGTSYPYFYCVLVAKPGFGLKSYLNRASDTERIVYEYQEDEEAEVLVIRQRTTARSGYHTDDKACSAILASALNVAR